MGFVDSYIEIERKRADELMKLYVIFYFQKSIKLKR